MRLLFPHPYAFLNAPNNKTVLLHPTFHTNSNCNLHIGFVQSCANFLHFHPYILLTSSHPPSTQPACFIAHLPARQIGLSFSVCPQDSFNKTLMGVALQDWVLNINTCTQACADSKVCQKLISAHMSQARRRASFGGCVFLISERASVCVCACVPVPGTDSPANRDHLCPAFLHHPYRCPTGGEPGSEISLLVTHAGTESRRRTIGPHPVSKAAALPAWAPHWLRRCATHPHNVHRTYAMPAHTWHYTHQAGSPGHFL